MSIVYKLNDTQVVKVFRQGITFVDVLHEYDMSLKAYNLGMPTPKPYEIVEISQASKVLKTTLSLREEWGKAYGIIYDLIKGETLSEAITKHPEHLTAYALQMSHLYQQLHSTIISKSDSHKKNTTLDGLGAIPNAHKSEAEAIRRITPIIGRQGAKHLLKILHSVPQGHSLLHCDLHPRNIMLCDGTLKIIDMGEVGYGNPLIDMSHVHALMTSGLIDIDHFMGFPAQYAKPLWDTVLHDYYNTLSHDEYVLTINTLGVVSLIRCFTWLAVSDGLPQEVITRFQHHFLHCVEDRWEEINTLISNE